MAGQGSVRPAIGVTTGRVVLGDRVTDGTQHDYGAAVARAGGRPYLLPTLVELAPEEVLAPMDGLLLTGGGDVDPSRYGAEPAPATSGVDPERDQVELGLLAAARAGGLPVLGICRGVQLLNVGLGGTLVQDLPSTDGWTHFVLGSRQVISHVLRLEPSSGLSRLVGAAELGVNSIHHQGVAEIAPDLRPVAWAEDGLVEALEGREEPLLGVQWHPENLVDLAPHHLAPFRWLVTTAAGRATDDAALVPSSKGTG